MISHRITYPQAQQWIQWLTARGYTPVDDWRWQFVMPMNDTADVEFSVRDPLMLTLLLLQQEP